MIRRIRGLSTLSTNPSTLSNHFTTTMVDIPPSEAWLLVISRSGAKPSICTESCFRPHRRNSDQVDSLFETTTIPTLDQLAPNLGINLSLALVVSTTS